MASRGSSEWRASFWGPGCDPSVIIAVPWIIGAGKIQCHRDAWSAFRALGRTIRVHNYNIDSDETGCYNCRKITGGSATSAHSQGIAIDINWNSNPYRKDKLVTDMPRVMVAAIHGLQTPSGLSVFRWGGDWDNRPETPHSNYDAMHYEIIVSPAELDKAFIIDAFDESNHSLWPLLVHGDNGPAVAQLQKHLNLRTDGDFGPRTLAAVQEFQTSRGLGVDGHVGAGTWTALITQQPPLQPGDPPPTKKAA